MAGAAPKVVRNDAMTVDEMLAMKPDGILLSPGPGRPEDAGVCLPLLERRPQLPLFGVCLGHQALGSSFGAVVDRAPVLMHGKTSSVRHDGEGLFQGVPNPFQATRYHSLEVRAESLPEELVATAWTDDAERTVMAMRHRELPYWGVQFHPESVLTIAGPRIVDNFLALCARWKERKA
jgi:anthranilate synthase component 2